LAQESESGELELDLDQMSPEALGRLYDLVVKAFPHMKPKVVKKELAESPVAGKMHKTKKHKPMGKAEQERSIEKLKEIKAQFQQRQGSGSQEPLPSVEKPSQAQEDSEEDSDQDSEEE